MNTPWESENPYLSNDMISATLRGTSKLDGGLAHGQQAQVYNALWLLGRQWQMLKLEGEEAGSPVAPRGRILEPGSPETANSTTPCTWRRHVPSQIGHSGRIYYRKNIAEGKSRKEALRCLKRRISDAVVESLITDLQAPSRSAA
jgi:hypothetical protein